MNNHVETLRAILFYRQDLETITNLEEIEADIGHTFTNKEFALMIEFKKIYELGLDQLKDNPVPEKNFVDILHMLGPKTPPNPNQSIAGYTVDELHDEEVDEYTIIYYMDLLLNGPLGSYVKPLTEDFDTRYWAKTPDCLGNNANKTKNSANITMFEGVGYPLGCVTDTYNRLPGFMQTTMTDGIKVTEDLFRSSMKSTTEIDNTLPMVDKHNQQRYDEESQGGWVQRPHGTMMVKDSYMYLVISAISQELFDKVKMHLRDKEGKDESFRLYTAKKTYTAFDSDKNTSTSNILKVEKEFFDGEDSEIITLDVMGDEFDSFERRDTILKVTNPIKDEEFKLNTNEGALGN